MLAAVTRGGSRHERHDRRILPITAVIVPFWLVRAMVGWKETFEVLPAILVVGISFAFHAVLLSNHMDSNLVDITQGCARCLHRAIPALWKPKRIWRFAGKTGTSASSTKRETLHESQVFKGWVPFLILSLFVFLWGYSR